jgi:Cu(I)/Ag(I) efflux system membrane fusion protein
MKSLSPGMKLLLTLLQVIVALSGIVPLAVHAAGDDQDILYWVAPMDPNFRRDQPGKSPMGMDLVPVYKNANDESGTISISPVVEQNLGVRTTAALRTTLWRGIDTVGYVDYNESLVSHIHLRTQGWVERLAVKSEGERVKKGERLFDLYSPELVNAQEEFVSALASGNKGLQRASAERLAALGISDNQIKALQASRKPQQRISFYAPQDGVVFSLSAREGMFVKPEMRIMSLGDLSSVWLLAEVFERQTNWVEVGQPTEASLSFIPGKIWEGKVEYIYPSLDPVTRTLKVRLRFDNPGEQLKPNMYANVKIYTGGKSNLIVIPLEALIRTGRQDHVIVSSGDGKFNARDVVVGIESGDYVEIQKGINEGDQVVVSGQFLLDSEASTRASFARMTEPTNTEASTPMPAEPKTVMATGVIKALLPDERKLTIEHGPISELGWPAMTMDFALADDIDLGSLSNDEKIMFQLEQRDERYLITSIHKADAMPAGDMEQPK